MNTDTGEIKDMGELRKVLGQKLPPNWKEMQLAPTPLQAKRAKVGRNDPCPCGSGKKFKKCCYTGGKAK